MQSNKTVQLVGLSREVDLEDESVLYSVRIRFADGETIVTYLDSDSFQLVAQKLLGEEESQSPEPTPLTPPMVASAPDNSPSIQEILEANSMKDPNEDWAMHVEQAPTHVDRGVQAFASTPSYVVEDDDDEDYPVADAPGVAELDGEGLPQL